MAFDQYAKYYDAFYKTKDYGAECRFLESLFKRYAKKSVKTILDLGCGTGNHLVPLLKRGYDVVGMDASSQMLKIAQAKIKNLGLRARFKNQNLKSFTWDGTFDAAVCLFSVIDYLTETKDVLSMLKRVREHLKPQGIFIFDFWNAPAVERYYSPVKLKNFASGDQTIERHSKTRIDRQQRMCWVDYTCSVKQNKKLVDTFKEQHTLRYFSIEEMKELVFLSGMRPVGIYPFMNMRGKIRKNTWDVAFVAQKA